MDESFGEELANSLTHGLGVLLSVVGLVVLVTMASLEAGVWHIVGSAVFGVSLIVLYTASTLFHSFRSRRHALYSACSTIPRFFF